MKIELRNEKTRPKMQGDCGKCSGLCCIALFFSPTDGFPDQKAAGEPCLNLRPDYRCKIHSQLKKEKMKGCIGYDCFGAGQQVTQVIYQGQTWQDLPQQSPEIFTIFTSVFQLLQIKYYLREALTLLAAKPWENEIQSLINENITLCNSSPASILSADLAAYKHRASAILKQVCLNLEQGMHRKHKKYPASFLGKNFQDQDLSGWNLSMRLLLAANFTGCRFDGAIFLGADTRDANFNNVDLREAVFLTQGQVNSAKGNSHTKLPPNLDYPITWA